MALAGSAGPSLAQDIVGHRGASYDAPENTMSAFMTAWDQEADGIEGDFYFTKDQRIVCIHDANTERTGGKKLDVAKSTLAELQALEYGKWKDTKFDGEPIPTFDEVLRSIPAGKLFVVELKTGPDIVPLLKKRIDAAKRTDIRMLIIAFNAETVKACKKQLPNVRAHWLTSFKQDKETKAWAPSAAQVAKTIADCSADGIGFRGERAVLNDSFVAEIKAGGCKEFHVWTIDDPQDAEYFKKLGAVGITTNRPKFIRDSLAAKPTVDDASPSAVQGNKE
ncbi:MAG: glycerophosphodiester phosphodiesterase [Pirellulales bacterium]